MRKYLILYGSITQNALIQQFENSLCLPFLYEIVDILYAKILIIYFIGFNEGRQQTLKKNLSCLQNSHHVSTVFSAWCMPGLSGKIKASARAEMRFVFNSACFLDFRLVDLLLFYGG